jgi:hypothetical protein
MTDLAKRFYVTMSKKSGNDMAAKPKPAEWDLSEIPAEIQSETR